MVYIIEKLQGILSYDGCTNYQFAGNGIGKIGTSGFLLGFVGGKKRRTSYVLLSVFLSRLFLFLLRRRSACGLHCGLDNRSMWRRIVA